jgi:hypothetical protein
MLEKQKKRKSIRESPELLEWTLAIDLLKNGEQVK